jgi:hypothetical protein
MFLTPGTNMYFYCQEAYAKLRKLLINNILEAK